MRQIVRECHELLKQLSPDTFLERKTMDVPRKRMRVNAGEGIVSNRQLSDVMVLIRTGLS